MEMQIKINKNLIQIVMYLTAGVVFLGLVLSKGTTAEASIGFYIGLLLVLTISKSLYSVQLYFLIISLNMYMLYVPLKYVNGITVTAVVYLYSILLLIYIFIKHKYVYKKLDYFIISLILYIIVSVTMYALISYLDKTSVLEIIWKMSPLYMGTGLALYLHDKPSKFNEFLIAIICAAILFTAVAYIELVNGKTFFYELWAGRRYRNGILRVGSTLGDPNTLAMYIVPFCFLLRTRKYQSILGKRLSLFLLISMLTLVVLSGSRTSLLAAIFGMGVWWLLNGKSRTKILAVFGGVAVLLTTPIAFSYFYNYDAASSGQRFMLVRKAIEIWIQHPLTGIGLDQFQKTTYWMTMNEYVKQLVEFGILGFLIYIAYYCILAIPVMRNMKKFNKTVRKEAAYLISSLAAFAFNSISMDSYFHYIMWIFPPLFLIFYIENIKKQRTNRLLQNTGLKTH